MGYIKPKKRKERLKLRQNYYEKYMVHGACTKPGSLNK